MTKAAVLDASAVLAVLFDEKGADNVIKYGPAAVLSAVSYGECLTKATDRGLPLEEAWRALDSFRFNVIPFDAEHAAVAASFRPATRNSNCSFADRACLATGYLRQVPVVTADRKWAKLHLGVEVILFRGDKEAC